MKIVRGWVLAGLLLALGACAKNSTGPKFPELGSARFTVTTRASIDDPVFTFFDVSTGVGTTVALFDTIAFDTTKVGRTYEATAANDTDFVKVAGRIADGSRSVVCTGDCDLFTCVSSCSDEKTLFGLGSTDFSPATVAQIDLRADSTAVGPSPFGGTVRTYFFTLTVFGTR